MRTVWLALLAAGVCLGCSRATGCPTDKECIRYMAWGNPEQLKVEREFVQRFNETNPDAHVKLFTVPGSSYDQKMTTMLVAGTAPDVLRCDHYRFPGLQKRGLFRDLTDLAAADPEFNPSDFVPQAIHEGTVDGRLYGMNALFGGVILYYNKSRYQELQLKDPYERYLEGTWTWAQYLADAKVLTKFENGRPMRFGTEAPPQPMNFPVLWAFECEPFDEKRGRASVNSEGCKAGYGFIADLIWKHHVAPTASQGANAAFTFESGKLGLKYDWMGMTPRYRELIKDFEWDIVPLPKGNREHQSCVKGNQLVIAKNSKNPKLAWRFIRFMTGVETESRLYGVIRRSFPSRKSVAFSDTFLKTDQPPFNTKALTDTVANGRYLPITDRWNEWTQILSAEADNLLAGREKDPKIMIERAQEKINKVLSEEPGF